MKIDVTRRDVLKFGAGAAVGIMATPAPWKAIDDLAIWTQNWKWIPVPPKGPVTTRSISCSLCPAGCTLNARCVSAMPVSMHSATAEQSLCALGMTGHHLPYHPARLTASARVVHTGASPRRINVPFDSVVSEARKAIAGKRGSVAVLDTRPGRSSSIAWRNFLASIERGIYVPAPSREGAALATLAAMTGIAPESIALDLAGAQTIVSFGAPLAEGWGNPALTQRLLRRDPSLRVVQVEPIRSATAAAASRWLPALPGTEAVLALGLANILIAENLVARDVLERVSDRDEYLALVHRFHPEVVSRATRIPVSEILATAREMASHRPALVVAGEDPGGGRFDRATETAIAGLNLLLGSTGIAGGVVERDPLPSPLDDGPLVSPKELHEIEDRSISVLIVDASDADAPLPWNAIERKLVANERLVIALAPYFTGLAAHADYVVPAPPFMEGLHEVTSSFDSPVPTFAVAGSLIQPRAKSHDAGQLLAAISGRGPANGEELMKLRAAKIHGAAIGSVQSADGSSKEIAEFSSPDELWEALLAGAKWFGQPASQKTNVAWSLLSPAREMLLQLPTDGQPVVDAQKPLVLLARGTRDVSASAAVSPVMTKIYQESGLRRAASTVVMNPATAQRLRVRSGTTVKLETSGGALLTRVALDERVMPGVIAASIGPSASALGLSAPDGAAALLDILPSSESWRMAAASVVEA